MILLCTLLARVLFCYPSPPALHAPYYNMHDQCYGKGIKPGMAQEEIQAILYREAICAR